MRALSLRHAFHFAACALSGQEQSPAPYVCNWFSSSCAVGSCHCFDGKASELCRQKQSDTVLYMQHIHVMDIRPDVITRTGVVQPYAIRNVNPVAVARHSVQAFETTSRPAGPQVKSELQPEEFVARAKRVAAAVAAGKRMPRGTDPKLLQAAKAIVKGKPFVVRASGRAAQGAVKRRLRWTPRGWRY